MGISMPELCAAAQSTRALWHADLAPIDCQRDQLLLLSHAPYLLAQPLATITHG